MPTGQKDHLTRYIVTMQLSYINASGLRRFAYRNASATTQHGNFANQSLLSVLYWKGFNSLTIDPYTRRQNNIDYC